MATVDGTGSKWTNSSSLYVGNSGSGTLNITGGGTVSNTRRLHRLQLRLDGHGNGGRHRLEMDQQSAPLRRQLRQRDAEHHRRRRRQQHVAATSATIPARRAWRRWTAPARSGPTAAALYVGNSGSGTLNITGGGTVSNTYRLHRLQFRLDGRGDGGRHRLEMDQQRRPLRRQLRQRDAEHHRRRGRQQYRRATSATIPARRAWRRWTAPARRGPTAAILYVGYSGSGTLNIGQRRRRSPSPGNDLCRLQRRFHGRRSTLDERRER